MTNKRLKITTIILCCCIVVLLVAVIVLQSFSLANTIKQLQALGGDEPDKEQNQDTPNEPNKEEPSEPNQDEPDDDKPSKDEPVVMDFSDKIMSFVGDSITYGVDGVDGQRVMSYPLPKLVEMELNAKVCFNQGISGSTLCTAPDSRPVQYDRHPFVERISSVPSNCDVVCVFGGVNDFALGLPLGTIDDETNATVYGALNGIMTQLQTRCSNAFVFLMTPFGLSPARIANSPADYQLQDVVTAIKQIGDKYNVPVLDLYNDSGWRETEMLASNCDGIHPSQYFMARFVAPMVADFIRKNVQS